MISLRVLIVLWLVVLLVEARSTREAGDYENAHDRILAVNQLVRRSEEGKNADDIINEVNDAAGDDFEEGDIILTKEQKAGVKRSATRGAIWSNNIVPYVFSTFLKSSTRHTIQRALETLQQKTCVSFKLRTNERNYVEFFSGGGCYSYIGMTGGKQQVSIGRGCEYHGTIIHEIMHALGFWHEQSRPDRDGFVKIMLANVKPGMEHNFEKQGNSTSNTQELSYDFDSVMHYSSKAFSKNGQKTIEARNNPGRALGQKNGPSSSDIEGINKLYSCGKTGSCVNLAAEASCDGWAKSGECQKNSAYMLVECMKSCGKCPSTDKGSCVNAEAGCDRWAKSGECQKNPQYMLVQCMKSCGKCPSTD